MIKKYTTALIAFILISLSGRTQDVHFSQFYAEPWHVNPAKTGFFPGNYRLSGAYRSQWASVTAPFRTFSASGELGWEWKGANKDIFGLGAHAFSDKSGDANYTVNNVGLSTAYHFGTDRFHQHFVGIGGGANYVTHSLDPTRLKFDMEGSAVALPENFLTMKKSYLDLNMGFEYNYIPSEKFNVNAGLAVHHINQPPVDFIVEGSSHVFRKYAVNFGATYTIKNKYQFYPRLLASVQGPYWEVNTGFFGKVRLDKSRRESYALYIGTWYRWNDALIPVVRFDVFDTSLGFSYDINTSKLSQASHFRGGPELTILHTGKISGMSKRKVICPKF